jgi:GGDEF domain-containing protein
MMPELDGYEVCRELRSHFLTSNCAVIMLSARTRTSDILEGFESGADDYLEKPFEPAELIARVQSTLRRHRMIREASPLTGLPGNFAIQREIERRIRRTPQSFAVLHADIDAFKPYNDYYGYAQGDEVISVTGNDLCACLGSAADVFAGHIGGDDFVVICNPEDADRLCERITSTFDARVNEFYEPEDYDRGYIMPPIRSGPKLPAPLVSLSIGVATTDCRIFESHVEVAGVAAEMKAIAKARAGSNWAVDRRQGGSPR